jgi:hypothetical protein
VSSVEKLIEGAEAVLATDAASRDKLRSMSEQLMRNISEDLPEWMVFFHEYNTLTGTKRRDVVERRERYEQLWHRVLAEGQASGEFRPTEPILVKGLLGMHNYAYLWIRQHGTMEPEQIADIFCDVLLRGMLTPEQLLASGGGGSGDAVAAA